MYAADYDKKGSGILQGGTTLIGQVTTPAEMDYYKSIRYPDANSVELGLHTEEQLKNTPKNLQGLPMFVMTKTTGQKQDFGSPVFSGYGAGDKTAIRTAFEFAGFLEDGIRNDVKMYQMITMGMEEGMKPIAGPGARFGRWTQVTAQKLNTMAKFFGVDSGIPLANKLAGEDDYKKFYAAMGAARIDISPEAIKGSIRSDIDKMYAYNDALLSSDSPDALSQEEWAYNNDQIKVLDQMSQELQQRDDLNVIVSLMQKSAFTRARYLQGTNRLLKDVIGEARKIMDVMGKGEREALAILSENLSSYQRKYKEQLGIIWNPNTDMDKISRRSITIDKDFNVTGGLSAYDIGNISDDSPILGSQMNLNDPSVQNQIGNQTQFNSLEEQLESFGIEMPKGFK